MGEYSGLEGGPPGFGPRFTCAALLRDAVRAAPTGGAYGALTLCRRPSHAVRPARERSRRGRQAPGAAPCNPTGAKAAARVRPVVCPRPPFARRYSGDLAVDFFSSGYLDVSVPPVVLPLPIVSGGGCPAIAGRVRPFGYPGIGGCVPLPQAYRGLPRPSSASHAKASASAPCVSSRASRDDRARHKVAHRCTLFSVGCRTPSPGTRPGGDRDYLISIRCFLTWKCKLNLQLQIGDIFISLISENRSDHVPCSNG